MGGWGGGGVGKHSQSTMIKTFFTLTFLNWKDVDKLLNFSSSNSHLNIKINYIIKNK